MPNPTLAIYSSVAANREKGCVKLAEQTLTLEPGVEERVPQILGAADVTAFGIYVAPNS